MNGYIALGVRTRWRDMSMRGYWDERGRMSRDIESEIYDHQEKEILAKYGVAEKDRANYGWGVDDMDKYISVATKVYGPRKKLITTVYYATDNLTEVWEEKWESL
jgi:hypothetical protein